MKTSSYSPYAMRQIVFASPMAFIDLETTGSILGLDRIVEVGVLKILPSGEEIGFHSLINPEMAITPEATKKHGLTNEDTQDAPRFGVVSAQLVNYLDGCDLAGFNILNFDLPMLKAEFGRVGQSFSTADRHVIDVLDIFVQKEPRDLRSAYRFYCGGENKGAHSASSDARACWEVLQGQVRKYSDLPNTTQGLSSFVSENRRARALDSGGWFITRFGKAAFARGKYQGMLIREVEESDPSYLDWMFSLGLPEDTLGVIRGVLPDFGK